MMIDEGVNRLPVVGRRGPPDRDRHPGRPRAGVRPFGRRDRARDPRRGHPPDAVARADTIQVEVTDGEVRLAGEVETKTDAELIPTFVQRVPGVVSVLSKLRWLDENGSRPGRAVVWSNRA